MLEKRAQGRRASRRNRYSERRKKDKSREIRRGKAGKYHTLYTPKSLSLGSDKCRRCQSGTDSWTSSVRSSYFKRPLCHTLSSECHYLVAVLAASKPFLQFFAFATQAWLRSCEAISGTSVTMMGRSHTPQRWPVGDLSGGPTSSRREQRTGFPGGCGGQPSIQVSLLRSAISFPKSEALPQQRVLWLWCWTTVLKDNTMVPLLAMAMPPVLSLLANLLQSPICRAVYETRPRDCRGWLPLTRAMLTRRVKCTSASIVV